MKRSLLLAGVVIAAASSSLAMAAPESLLPPIFGDSPPDPAPAPTPSPSPSPSPGRDDGEGAESPSTPVVQPLPGLDVEGDRAVRLPEDFPSLAEIQEMDVDEIDALLGLRPKFDIPPGAQRAVSRVGVIGPQEGGFATGSLAQQPAALVEAALRGIDGPMVSRWGHILLRRALASRLDAPAGMDPVSFAAQRAALLNRMGESAAARAIVQDVDSANYDAALAGAALDAYLATGDILGICPVTRLKIDLRQDDQNWQLARWICIAYSGEPERAVRELTRLRSRGTVPAIDALLAQRFAGAVGEARSAVNIEWDDVDELTPWRSGLARALGIALPDGLRSGAGAPYDFADVLTPATPLPVRLEAADRAAARGVISAAAMVDLYSQIFADRELERGEGRERALQLREAYVADDPVERLSAIEGLWNDGDNYGRRVLTAYAAARMPVAEDLADDAGPLIASMLTAGLDRNAMRWGNVVANGSLGWALLAIAAPDGNAVSGGAVEGFAENDGSTGQRKSRFLIAGLAALGRLDQGDAQALASDIGFGLTRQSPWSERIDRAGELRNRTLVALLVAVGMQGDGWDRMTPRQLFHIVRALDRSSLNAEARMIAAEAVARG